MPAAGNAISASADQSSRDSFTIPAVDSLACGSAVVPGYGDSGPLGRIRSCQDFCQESAIAEVLKDRPLQEYSGIALSELPLFLPALPGLPIAGGLSASKPGACAENIADPKQANGQPHAYRRMASDRVSVLSRRSTILVKSNRYCRNCPDAGHSSAIPRRCR